MNKDRIHSELAKGILSVPNLPYSTRWLRGLTRLIFGLASRTKGRPDVSIRTETVGAGLRIYTPAVEPKAALFWIHGGGHIVGSSRSLDAIASSFAHELGVVVVAPSYRLAPKNPFPADLDDCRAAWDWLVSSADQLGVDAERIGLLGNSAGGGLAAALALQLRDDQATAPAAQVLFYPMLDDRTATDERLDAEEYFVWSNASNRVAWTDYLRPASPGDSSVSPYAAPARAQALEGLPPTWIGVGDIDLFFEEDRKYAARLKEAGVDCDLVEVEGAPHAFEAIVPDADVSKRFVASALSFLEQRLIH